MTSTVLYPMTLLLVAAVACLISGAVLVWRGLWPRREGDTRFCRACNYNLTGLESDRCPECGTKLNAQTIVIGRRVRRPGMIASGSLLLILAIGAGGVLLMPTVRGINWYAFRPDGWVLTDAQSSDRTLARKAWKEIDRRYKAGSLSSSVQKKLIALGLAEQTASTSSPVRWQVMNHLGRCYVAGQLSEAQEKKFFEQMVTMELKVRGRVARGDQVPYRIHHRWCGPWGFNVKISLVGHQIDDQRQHRGRGGLTVSINPLPGRTSIWRFFPSGEPGKHTVAITLRVQIFQGPLSSKLSGRIHYDEEIKRSAEFEVLDVEPQSIVKLVKDDDSALEIRNNIRVQRFRLELDRPYQEKPRSRYLDGTVSVGDPPANVAFDVFVRTGSREYRLGCIAKGKGARRKWGVDWGLAVSIPVRRLRRWT